MRFFFDEQSRGRLLVDYEIVEQGLDDAEAQVLILHHFFGVLLDGDYRDHAAGVSFAPYGRERFDASVESGMLGEDGRAEVQFD